MLSLTNVFQIYSKKSILNNISFSFHNTGLYLIYGDNGAGKSTLLNVLSGKLIPDSGKTELPSAMIWFPISHKTLLSLTT